MPTYTYRCEKCAHQFDEFQRMTADSLRVCPECGEESLKRLIGAGAGIIFKGSGYYVTDYVRKTGNQGNGTTGAKKSEVAGTSEKPAKTEQKKSENSNRSN